jgi:uncharacterized protein YndB with AHSA1/START domain
MSGIPPVVESIEVDREPKVAFEVFTAAFGRWWPHLGHSVGEERVAEVVMEARVGGRILERWADGSEHLWGTISVFEPPSRVVFSWDPSGRRAETEVEVSFSETPDGRTLVELTHRNWEVLGVEAPELRESYRSGWPRVLGAFAGFTDKEE